MPAAVHQNSSHFAPISSAALSPAPVQVLDVATLNDQLDQRHLPLGPSCEPSGASASR